MTRTQYSALGTLKPCYVCNILHGALVNKYLVAATVRNILHEAPVNKYLVAATVPDSHVDHPGTAKNMPQLQ